MPGPETTLVNSIIGPGTYVRGHIESSGLLRIDGDLSGSVKTDGRVIVGRGGRADATIDAATVVIGGAFRGTIYASEKVVALESAVIIGSIYCARVVVEPGVLLDGALHVRGERAEHAGISSERPALSKRVAGSRRRRSRTAGGAPVASPTGEGG